MLNAAFTLVQNDMVILNLWLSYYSKYFDYLVVIGNGTKESYGKLEPLKEKYDFYFERIDFAGNSESTLDICKRKQKELLEKYNWVLYCDCDEFIVADPKKYMDLRVFMDAYPAEKCYCEGFNVLQVENEQPINFAFPYLSQRKYWSKDIDYNKPLLSKVPLNWAPGCHREMEIPDTDGKKIADTGLFLHHLKYADLKYKEPRDLGPTFTNLDHGKITEGMKIKQEIPQNIRRLF